MVEIYVSTDIETDGPLPGPNSMLSFGSAAFSEESGLLDTFTANLDLLPGAKPDPRTKEEFWDKNPEAWKACRFNPKPLADTMQAYVAWVKKLPGKPVFVGYPVTFDFMFMYYYMLLFAGESPFSFSGLDMKSFAMAKLGTKYRETTKRNMPRKWFVPNSKHTHIALDDAIEQGYLFMEMLKHK